MVQDRGWLRVLGSFTPVDVAIMRGLLSALVLVLSVSGVRGEDWPQWGGHSDRNMVARAKNLPCCFVPGKKCSGGTKIDLKTSRNVRWVARLGSQTYSSPAVAGGKLFIGTNDFDLDDPRFHSTGGGQVLALDMASGRLLWRLVVPKLESKQKSRNSTRWNWVSAPRPRSKAIGSTW